MPTSFAAWTGYQKTTVPAQVLARCSALWSTMNPNGTMRVLPPDQDPTDGSKLALKVCMAANLPADWPQHQADILDVKRILDRSTELGQPLTLPRTLAE